MDLEIRPLTAKIGAEVFGIDLAAPSDHDIDELRKAWLDWKVLFFRDQAITREQHIAFGRRFGDLEVHPFVEADERHPEIVVLNSDAERPIAASYWHSDVTWREEPSHGSILRGVIIPPAGGDTLFADAAEAYKRLSDKWKERVEGASAIHDYVRAFGADVSDDAKAETRAKYPPARHPVVRTHPETGAKSIYTNRVFTSHIEGMTPDESRDTINHLDRAIADPSVQCRFRWQVDSFAMWDNRAVQHFATNDYHPEARRVERVTIVGDRPF